MPSGKEGQFSNTADLGSMVTFIGRLCNLGGLLHPEAALPRRLDLGRGFFSRGATVMPVSPVPAPMPVDTADDQVSVQDDEDEEESREEDGPSDQ